MYKFSLYLFAAIFILAGINHFINPTGYLKVMPPLLPWPLALVYISGVFEITLAALLLPIKTRKLAAWGIVILLIAVFPANIQMMINYKLESHPSYWMTVVRLPLQLLLIWWAYYYTKSKYPTRP